MSSITAIAKKTIAVAALAVCATGVSAGAARGGFEWSTPTQSASAELHSSSTVRGGFEWSVPSTSSSVGNPSPLGGFEW